MLPNKWQNGAQCCFSMFDCRLFISKFFVKAVCHLLVSFNLIHFHPRLVQPYCIVYTSLSFACPINENNQRRTCNMYLHTFGFKSCSILTCLYIWMLSFSLNQVWIGINDILLNFFAIFIHTGEQWRLVVKLAGRAAKFHLWLNIWDCRCRPGCFCN